MLDNQKYYFAIKAVSRETLMNINDPNTQPFK